MDILTPHTIERIEKALGSKAEDDLQEALRRAHLDLGAFRVDDEEGMTALFETFVTMGRLETILGVVAPPL